MIEQIKECNDCPLRAKCNQVVTGIGSKESKLFIVADKPETDEDIIGEPLVGLSGKYFDKILNGAGISRENIYITYVVKCKTPHALSLANESVQICKKWLWQELQMIKPKVIVTLGAFPTSLLMKKKRIVLNQVVGLIYQLNYLDSILMPWYDPDYLLQRGKSWEIDSINFFKEVKGKL